MCATNGFVAGQIMSDDLLYYCHLESLGSSSLVVFEFVSYVLTCL